MKQKWIELKDKDGQIIAYSFSWLKNHLARVSIHGCSIAFQLHDGRHIGDFVEENTTQAIKTYRTLRELMK